MSSLTVDIRRKTSHRVVNLPDRLSLLRTPSYTGVSVTAKTHRPLRDAERIGQISAPLKPGDTHPYICIFMSEVTPRVLSQPTYPIPMATLNIPRPGRTLKLPSTPCNGNVPQRDSRHLIQPPSSTQYLQPHRSTSQNVPKPSRHWFPHMQEVVPRHTNPPINTLSPQADAGYKPSCFQDSLGRDTCGCRTALYGCPTRLRCIRAGYQEETQYLVSIHLKKEGEKKTASQPGAVRVDPVRTGWPPLKNATTGHGKFIARLSVVPLVGAPDACVWKDSLPLPQKKESEGQKIDCQDNISKR